MTTVTVELEDLETIVMATGVIKTIEGALATRRTDPFTRSHLDFTAAHDRMAQAMRNATRAEAGTATGWDDPLTKIEAKTLVNIIGVTDGATDAKGKRVAGLPFFALSPTDKVQEPVYDKLAAKGCVRIGQFVEGVVFTGEPAARIKADPQRGYAIEVTPRGRTKLAEAQAK